MQLPRLRPAPRAPRPNVQVLEARVTPTTDIILDFDGGTLQNGQGYIFPTGFGTTFTAYTGFGAAAGGGGTFDLTEQILQIVAGVREDFADFDVRVIWDDRGVASPFFDAFDTVIMTVAEDGGPFGVAASVDLPQTARDVALAFQPTHEDLDTPATARRSVRELIDTISHEVGHNFGLNHTTNADAERRQITTVAGQNVNLDSRFSATVLNHVGGETPPTYAERARLQANLGLAPAGTTLLSQETVTGQTLPQDTTANNFDGTTPLTLPGQIDFAGDRDAFRIIAGADGTFNVTLRADAGSGIAPILTVWDAHGDFIVAGSQGVVGGFSTITVTVTAGQTFYVLAGTSYDRTGSTVVGTPTLGAYTLTVGGAPPGPGPGPTPGGAIVLAVGADAGGAPVVRLLDASGAAVRQIIAYDRRFTGGVRVATADVNGDGTLDVITGAGVGGGPHVKVYDGATGAELANFFPFDPRFTGGVYVAGGDVNGDGRADIIVAAGAGGGPHVKVFSGVDGRLIGNFFAYETGFRGGVFVTAGDTNGDGVAEIVTGTGVGGGPLVRTFTAGGFMLQSFFAYATAYRGGVHVAAGDLNGDGRADIVTGPGTGSSHVRAFNAADGRSLVSFAAYSTTFNSQFVGDSRYGGGARVFAMDADGDGLMDIAVTPTAGGRPRVSLYSGSSGAAMSEFDAFEPRFLGGVFVG